VRSLNGGKQLRGRCPHRRAPGALALSLDSPGQGEGSAKTELRSLRGAHSERSERLKEKNQRRPHPTLSQVRERD
jgi:hypothetical protein